MTQIQTKILLKDFQAGKTALFTKNFVTYHVKYVKSEGEYIWVQIEQLACIHKVALETFGFKSPIVYPNTFVIKIKPHRLWMIQEVLPIKQIIIEKFKSLFKKIS